MQNDHHALIEFNGSFIILVDKKRSAEKSYRSLNQQAPHIIPKHKY